MLTVDLYHCFRTHSQIQVKGQTQGERVVKIVFRIKKQRKRNVYRKDSK